MKGHITAGVAGHVDHGKTSLVRCLTGVDTDRLKEEKRRGLTIEPGIAPCPLPSGAAVSLVDVPGHGDFLKNTIRGLCSVDMAVLVVAADDGVMPQTLDHLEILKFMGAQSGIVVLSKADLVDDETLEMAELEVRELLEGTFLHGKPVIGFSAVDQRGLHKILSAIETSAGDVCGRNADMPFRLWIDQVRSFAGFGTVASGTIVSGVLSREDAIEILPLKKQTKARFIEVHHKRVDRALPGQRAGINLHRISMEEAAVGMVLASPASLDVRYVFNAELSVLSNAPGAVQDRRRIKVYTGTCAVTAHVVLMDKRQVRPGETGLVQFRLLDPLALRPGDRFVISPMSLRRVTGGGVILEAAREKYRLVKSKPIVRYLEPLRAKDLEKAVGNYFQRELVSPVNAGDVARETGFDADRVHARIQSGVSRREIFPVQGKGYFGRIRFEALKDRIPGILKEFFRRNPLAPSMKANEIRKQLAPLLDDKLFQMMLEELGRTGAIITGPGSDCRLPDLRIRLLPEQEKVAAILLRYAKESNLVPFSPGKFCRLNPMRRTFNAGEVQRILECLSGIGRLVRLNDGRYITPQALEEIKRAVRDKILEKGSLILDDIKDVLGYGRTRGIPVFEYLDEIGFTVRTDDRRVLGPNANPPDTELAHRGES